MEYTGHDGGDGDGDGGDGDGDGDDDDKGLISCMLRTWSFSQ